MGGLILVTGAGGFVGRHVIAALVRAGRYRVVAIDRKQTPPPLEEGVRYLRADLCDPAVIDTLTEEGPYTGIVHLAGLLSKGDDLDTHRRLHRVNVGATLSMLEVARRHQSAFVFPSTGLVYGDRPGPFTEDMTPRPGDFYALSKLMGEEFVGFFARRHGLRTVVMRPSIIYGPGQTGGMFIPALIDALRAGREFPMTAGEQKRDFVYVEDVASAVLAALEHEDTSTTVNIGGCVSGPIVEVARIAEKLVGTSGLLRPGAVPYREHEVWDYALDSTRAEEVLGWRPRVSIEEGLRRTIAQAVER
jgi:UDP-glucose 4-epimerase